MMLFEWVLMDQTHTLVESERESPLVGRNDTEYIVATAMPFCNVSPKIFGC